MPMTRRSPIVLGLAALLASTSRAQPALDPRADEIIEAAFRQQVSFWLSEDARAVGTVVCLAVEQAGVAHSVARQYLPRFHEPSVRRAAECEGRPRGAVERATGRPAVLLTVGPIVWKSPDEAWITVRHFKSQLSTAAQQYRVVKEQARWICLGQILKMSPA
jgi:hypothetical protein